MSNKRKTKPTEEDLDFGREDKNLLGGVQRLETPNNPIQDPLNEEIIPKGKRFQNRKRKTKKNTIQISITLKESEVDYAEMMSSEIGLTLSSWLTHQMRIKGIFPKKIYQ